MKTNLIYGLRDPRNDVYKYIGKTTVGEGRPINHLIKSHNRFVNQWVKELCDLGMTPLVDIIEKDIPLNDLSEKEKYYISYFSELYGELFNGGELVFECINNPSILTNTHLDNTFVTLLNPGEIFKILKLSTGFKDEIISNMLNVKRNTLWRMKNGNTNVTLDMVIRAIFFSKYSIIDIYNFYIENSNEFLGNHPDTFEDFINKFNCDELFVKKWSDKFFNSKAILNKVTYKKRFNNKALYIKKEWNKKKKKQE